MYSRNSATLRRLHTLQRILSQTPNNYSNGGFFGVKANMVRAFNVDGRVTIDDVAKDIRPAKNPEYVPKKFCKR